MQQGGAGPEPHSRLAAPHPDCTCRTDVSAPCAPLHTRSASTAQAKQTERYIEALRQQLKHEVYLLWLYLLWLYLLWLAAQARVGPPYRARTIPNPEAYPLGMSAGRAAASAAAAALRMRPRPARQPRAALRAQLPLPQEPRGLLSRALRPHQPHDQAGGTARRRVKPRQDRGRCPWEVAMALL